MNHSTSFGFMAGLSILKINWPAMYRSVSDWYVVDLGGLEPPTCGMQNRRADQLRHRPKKLTQHTPFEMALILTYEIVICLEGKLGDRRTSRKCPKK